MTGPVLRRGARRRRHRGRARAVRRFCCCRRSTRGRSRSGSGGPGAWRRRRRRCRKAADRDGVDLRRRARRASTPAGATPSGTVAGRHRGLRRVHARHHRHARRCTQGARRRHRRRPLAATRAGGGLRRRDLGRLRHGHVRRRHPRALRSRPSASASGRRCRSTPFAGARVRRRRSCLSSGAILVTGGVDANGTALDVGGPHQPDGAIQLDDARRRRWWRRASSTPPPRPSFPTATARILFGGLPTGTTGAPVAERLVGQAFTAYDVGAQPNRLNATATTMPNGDVLDPRRHDRDRRRRRRAW